MSLEKFSIFFPSRKKTLDLFGYGSTYRRDERRLAAANESGVMINDDFDYSCWSDDESRRDSDRNRSW